MEKMIYIGIPVKQTADQLIAQAEQMRQKHRINSLFPANHKFVNYWLDVFREKKVNRATREYYQNFRG